MKTKWSKVKPGDVVQLSGREWLVEKVKPKGGSLRVSVRSGSHTAESKVDPSSKVVTIEPRRAESPTAPKAKSAPSLKPPAEAVGDPWETQQDRIEKRLDQILGARLVGEATDPDAGYYVPMVDLSTVAAHVAIFHGGVPAEHRGDDAALVGWHAREHVTAMSEGRTLPQNHWHSDARPTTATKKGKK